MKKSFFLKLLAVFFIFSTFPVYSQSGITSLIHRGETVITACQDGFIVTWNVNQRAAAERFQLTTYRIQNLVAHPQKDEICVVEAASPDNYKISVWNYALKQKLFTLHSSEPVTYINYSGSGSCIIAAGLNGSQITLIDSETGQIADTPDIPKGTTAFAATGRSERNMIVYQSEHENYSLFDSSFLHSLHGGQILYYDFESGSVISHFLAPGGFSNPVIFNNNSFIAGINVNGLLLVDAASGAVFDTIEDIGRDALLYPLNNELLCLSRRGNETKLYRFSVDANGILVTRQEFSLSFDRERISAFAMNGTFVFASDQGQLFLLGAQNRLAAMTHNTQKRVTEIASGTDSIAFLTEEGELGFIPLDYRLLERTPNLTLVKKEGFRRITPLPPEEKDKEQFILWHSNNTRAAPQLISTAQDSETQSLSFLTGRFPLRSISLLNNKLLTLDTGGNISIRNTEDLSARAEFTFSSAGAIDAAFVNNDFIILSRSVTGNNSPFLLINLRTGETVPITYPAHTALTVTSGKSGNIYAEIAQRQGDRFRTSVINISPALRNTRTAAPEKIFEYQGEATVVSIAESGGRLAIACGSEGAILFANEPLNFERTPGLPVKLLGNDQFFISLDSEGNIAWHDNSNGKILAAFRVYEDSNNQTRWTLRSSREFSGRFSN